MNRIKKKKLNLLLILGNFISGWHLGFFYRISKDLLGFSRDDIHWLMSIHEGEWLGDNGELIYVILNSLGLIWMIITGLQMFAKKIPFFKKVSKSGSKG